MAKLPNWTDKEIQVLENNLTKSNAELAIIFAEMGYEYRTTTSIEQKRRKLGLQNPTVFWSSKEIQVLIDNYEIMEDKQLTQLLPGKSELAINQKRQKLGLSKNNKWTDADKQVLRDNYHKGTKICCELLPHHPLQSILTIANDLGLRVDPRTVNRKWDYNQSYFSVLTLENCYWAGFIAADGCIHDNGGFSLELAIKDKKHLEKFNRAIEHTGQPKEYYYQMEDRKDVHKICLNLTGAQQWSSDLVRHFNITPRKTKTLQSPPNLTFEEQMVYVAGYTDGDGSIFISSKNNLLHYSVVGSLSLIQYIKNTFDCLIECPEQGKRGSGCIALLSRERYSFDMYRYTLVGKRAIQVLQKIKSLAQQHGVPLLERKWGKVPTTVE